jgi:hypothetical protein
MTDSSALYSVLSMRICCPQCGAPYGFFKGPRGGMSQNIYCKNADCRQGFNVTALTPTEGIAERIGPADAEQYKWLKEKYPKVW